MPFLIADCLLRVRDDARRGGLNFRIFFSLPVARPPRPPKKERKRKADAALQHFENVSTFDFFSSCDICRKVVIYNSNKFLRVVRQRKRIDSYLFCVTPTAAGFFLSPPPPQTEGGNICNLSLFGAPGNQREHTAVCIVRIYVDICKFVCGGCAFKDLSQ